MNITEATRSYENWMRQCTDEDLPKKRDEMILLHAMGAEAGNVHLGTSNQRKQILNDLQKRKSGWLRDAVSVLEPSTIFYQTPAATSSSDCIQELKPANLSEGNVHAHSHVAVLFPVRHTPIRNTLSRPTYRAFWRLLLCASASNLL